MLAERHPLLDNMNIEESKSMPKINQMKEISGVKKRAATLVLNKYKNQWRCVPREKTLGLNKSNPAYLKPVIPLVRIEGQKSQCSSVVSGARSLLPAHLGEELRIVRNLISTIIIHPNLLGHEDFCELRKFLESLGVSYRCECTDVCIPLEPTCSNSLVRLHPPLPKREVPVLYSFGFIKNMIVDAESKSVIITNFGLLPTMKSVLSQLIRRLNTSPSILYQPYYLFLYEFMIQFGAKPVAIDNFIKASTPNSNRLKRKTKKMKGVRGIRIKCTKTEPSNRASPHCNSRKK